MKSRNVFARQHLPCILATSVQFRLLLQTQRQLSYPNRQRSSVSLCENQFSQKKSQTKNL